MLCRTDNCVYSQSLEETNRESDIPDRVAFVITIEKTVRSSRFSEGGDWTDWALPSRSTTGALDTSSNPNNSFPSWPSTVSC